MKKGILTLGALIALSLYSSAQVSTTLSGTQPITLTNTGTGTYDKTVFYHTSANGLLFDLARTSNNIGSAPIDFSINARGGGANFLMIKGTTGNVGIGTTAPNARLHLNTVNSTALKFTRGSSTFGYEIGGTTFGLVDYASGQYKWRASDGNVFLVENSGNVGIGTTNPNPLSKLDVNGGIAANLGNSIAQFRAVHGGYGLMLRNDGNASYFLLTNQNDQYGSFNSKRPLAINNATGDFYVHSGAIYARASDGNVGIGTTKTSGFKLSVGGNMRAGEIEVSDPTQWADFVFDTDYELSSLEEVEEFIKVNNHLPDVPSEKEVLENGFDLAKMDAVLLQKIEELTLYMIDQKKEISQLKSELSSLKK